MMVFEFIIVALIGAIALGLYAKTGKLSNVFFGLSAIAYLILVSYVIYAYELSRVGIIIMLIISALIIMGIGYIVKREL